MRNYEKNPKHICLVSNTSWSFIKFRKNLISYFVENNYIVSLIAPEDEYTPQLKAMGVHFYAFNKLESKGKNPLKDYALINEFVKIYKKNKPDVIFQYTIKPNIYSTLAAYKCKIPVVAVITGLGYTFINKGIVPYIAKKMYKYALAKATQVWFLNNDDKDLFINTKIITAQKCSILNGEGIDVDYFAPRIKVETTTIKFLLIARLLLDKGVQEFHEAACRLKPKYPNAEFNFLGYLNVNNPMAVTEQQMKEWEATKAINYLGSTSDVRDIIATHDCIVLPSYREGISVTLMEAAAMQKPLIASNIAGCKELINENENGYLCKVKDAKSLAIQLEKFILLPQIEKEKMGKKSREKMKAEFSFSSIIPKYVQTINELT